ncbi:MAG: CCA tRNA nucleotidyltransferase [Candidatus Wallbacteria bacterium]|nr:CCA tRNA nucleotidyltransferase [Candidatus Wallbacteria bacterium]
MHHNSTLQEKAREIMSRLKESGFSAFLVGGCVRDLVLSRPPHDFDILTDAQAEDLQQLFEKVVPVGARHGTVTVVAGNDNFEVSSLPAGGSLESLRKNCSRRDFTINSMVMDSEGRLQDFFGGIADLKKRIIRAVEDPSARISEDRLRMLRAVRIFTTLDFTLDQDLLDAIKLQANLICSVSPERIRNELLQIMAATPGMQRPGIELLRETGLLAAVLPEVQRLVGFDQSSVHHKKDAYSHTLDVLENLSGISDSALLRFTALLHDIGKPGTRSGKQGEFHFYGHPLAGAELAAGICSRLRFSRKDSNLIETLIRDHMHFKLLSLSPTPRALARFIRKNGSHLSELLMLGRSDIELESLDWLDQKIQEFRSAFNGSLPAPLLDGLEIMEILKIPAGANVRRIKDFLLEEQIRGVVTTKEEAHRIILQEFGGKFL